MNHDIQYIQHAHVPRNCMYKHTWLESSHTGGTTLSDNSYGNQYYSQTDSYSNVYVYACRGMRTYAYNYVVIVMYYVRCTVIYVCVIPF